MAATFYAALGVTREADEETIRRAYRERAKACHPDVSDDPDARAQFKRLTTARDVLLDADARSRYDRLGHETYVRRHVDGAWGDGVSDDGGPTVGPEDGGVIGDADDAVTAARAYVARAATDGGREREGRAGRSAARAAAAGSGAAYYRPGERVRPDAGGGSPFEAIASLGPWLFLDGLLAASGVATAWLALAWTAASALGVAVACGVLLTTLAVTALHVTMCLSRAG
ncbi:MAG: DnaJ domain-containing protein [Haloarculaceae archaeon]